MKARRLLLGLAAVLVLVVVACQRDATPMDPDRTPTFATSAAPGAPTLLGPASGASVTVPVTISWTSVLDPTAINGGYNWQVSPFPDFSRLVLAESSRPSETSYVVSGLANGTYFWRVNAVDAGLSTSAWSEVRSFTVTGAGPGTPGTPTLNPTQGYSTFHPREVIRFSWSAVADAATYRLEVSSDPGFPVGTLPAGTVTFWNDNISGTSDGFEWGLGEGTFYARVFAVSADNPETGIRSLPSFVIQFTVFYNNPIGPPPVPASPAEGATVTLPFNVEWNHVPNPQPSGYELQVSPTADFSSNETELCVQLTEPRCVIRTLTTGKKFWRVRSAQGMASPTTVAMTGWSPVRTFTLGTAPPTPVSIVPVRQPLYSGDDSFVEVQLTVGAPSGGATATLSSSHPALAPVPSTLNFPATHALAEFRMVTGEVTTPTKVTLTATLNGVATSNDFTLHPPSLKSLTTPSPSLTGGMQVGATLMLNGIAPAGGATVSLGSNSPLAAPPRSVTIAAGGRAAPISIPTGEVTAMTSVAVTASWNGTTLQMPLTLHPSPEPAELRLTSATLVGGSGSTTGRPILVSRAGFDQSLRVSSNNPAVLPTLPASVIIPGGSDIGAFPIEPAAVSTNAVVTISVTGGGVTRSADLTVTPADAPSLTGFTVSPRSVEGGTSATGTVVLSRAAPTGGTVVSLGSRLPNTASPPPSVMVPAGASSASFSITTSPTAFLTTVELIATLNGVSLFAPLDVGPPPTPSAPSLISPANDAKPAQPVTFDWGDVTGGTSYTIEIDDDDRFPSPVVASQTVSASTATLTNLPARRLWWRVRAQNSAGVFGPYSSVRRFEPQSAPAAPALSSINLSPTSVAGGGTSRGTATLSAAAPSGGAVVSLSSSNGTVATAPASVTVPAGTTSAGFDVTTSTVAVDQTATISGSYGGATRSALLTVTAPPPPASLSAVSVDPSSVTGGGSSTGSVSLTSAAPGGGLSVQLSSSHAAASVPASVTVAAGATGASFAVTTTPVSATTSVTITAASGGVVRSTTLSVAPAATALSAPSLLSPANDARFPPGQPVTFDWSDVTGAASYTVEIDDDDRFASPLVLTQTVSTSQFTATNLPTRRMWWRVRANSSSGTPGPWSSVRRFELK